MIQILVILSAAIGAFHFGYQTVVIAGALLFIAKDFSLSLPQESVAASIIIMSILLTACVGGMLSDRLGRKKVMMLSIPLLLFGTAIVSLAGTFNLFLIGRFVQGIGLGLIPVVAPVYLAEIAPPAKRGTYVSAFQFSFVLGNLVAYGVNYIYAASCNWKMMFAIGLVPMALQGIALFFIPESPVWSPSTAKSTPLKEIFQKGSRSFLLIAVLLNIIQASVGANIITYFVPRIFQEIGFGTGQEAIFPALLLGFVNFLATVVYVMLIDRFGRKPLLMTGLLGMFMSLVLMIWSFNSSSLYANSGAIVSILCFVSFFAISMGPLPGLLVPEICPLNIRSQAMSIGALANGVTNYIVILGFLPLSSYISIGGVFSICALVCLLGAYFVYKRIPETKGRSLQ